MLVQEKSFWIEAIVTESYLRINSITVMKYISQIVSIIVEERVESSLQRIHVKVGTSVTHIAIY
jgi:hypothetical protein